MMSKIAWWIGALYYWFRLARRSKTIVPVIIWLSIIYGLAWLVFGDTATDIVFLLIRLGLQLALAVGFMVIQFVALFYFMAQSREILIRPGDPKAVTFSSYWGQPALVKMMKEWLYLLRDRGQFKEMGGRPISGILLSGPPGTGKTLLAKAMAGEGGVGFLGVEGSGFRAMFMGVDVMKVISFFKKARGLAKEYGAAIAYIDEIDAIGMSRSGVQGGGMMGMMGMGGGSGALTRLLYEMDGLGEISEWDTCQNITRNFLHLPPIDQGVLLVMGSTNRPDVLDPALVRPGRFDRTIQVDPPDRVGRREIIEGYLAMIKHRNVDVDSLVADTAWATPAKIASALLKDAVRIALFSGKEYVEQIDIEKSMLEQAMGIANPIGDMDQEQKNQIAYHEAGHAIAQYYLRPDERIVHLTITRRTQALGFMLPVSLVDIYTMPLETMVRDIMISLAGHVGTEVALGKAWTGASGDLVNVRGRIMQLATFGYFGAFLLGEAPSQEMREVIDHFLSDCLEKTKILLEKHRSELDALVVALLEKNDLSGLEVVKIIKESQ